MNQNAAKPGETVTVACKLPHGLWLEVSQEGKPITKILARGCNSTDIIGGFGMTDNVPKDFWEEWLKDHKELDFVKRGQIWAIHNRQSATSKALEMAEIKHGMERLNPDALPQGLEKGILE